MSTAILSQKQAGELLVTLKARFEQNMSRHKNLEWAQVRAKLEGNSEKLWSLNEMERTGGEPDVVGQDKKTGEYIFYDCSAESTKGRRSLCYDGDALQSRKEHKPVNISTRLTAGNCRSCHENIYQQFLRSRHAAPAWAAIYGEKGLTPERVNFSETFQPGGTRRPAHPFAQLEGSSAMTSGCEQCHSVGKPNSDGTIGTCTNCHTSHT